MIGENVDFVRAVRVAGPGREFLPTPDEPVDLVLEGGRIVDIAPTGNLRPRGLVVDGDGGWLLPGLWDHHVHVVQWALTTDRVALGEVGSAREAAAVMGAAPVGDGHRRVGVGFRDGLWLDEPTLDLLDATTGEVPTYLVNADVHSVWMNSAAFRREGFASAASGVLREEDAFEISRRLNAVDPEVGDRAVERMARAAAARGLVGLVDLDMTWNDEPWQRRVARGFDTLRVSYGTYPQHLDRAIAEGLRTGDPVRGATGDLVRVGPLKPSPTVARHAYGRVRAPLPGRRRQPRPPDHPARRTRRPHDACDCGGARVRDPRDRRRRERPRARRLRRDRRGRHDRARAARGSRRHPALRAPGGVRERPARARARRSRHDGCHLGRAVRAALPFAGLVDSGANLRFGSDAPVAAARSVGRDRLRGVPHARRPRPWQPHQRVDIDTAIAASTAGGSTAPAEIAPGARADLVIVDADPRTADELALRTMPVRTTLLAGRVTHAS